MLLENNCKQNAPVNVIQGGSSHPMLANEIGNAVCVVLDLEDGRCLCEGLVDSFSAIFSCCWAQEARASGVGIEGPQKARCPKRPA